MSMITELMKDLNLSQHDQEKLYELFKESVQISIANIEDYLSEQNMRMISLEANKIKKDAATVNIENIHNLAAKLEYVADQKQRLQCLTLFKELEKSIEAILEEDLVVA